MVGQGLPLWPGAVGHWQRPTLGDGLADRLGLTGLQLLQPQLELFDTSAEALRRAAELHPPQLGDLELEFFDLQGAQLDGELCRLKLGGRRRQLVLAGQRKGAQRFRIGRQIG